MAERRIDRNDGTVSPHQVDGDDQEDPKILAIARAIGRHIAREQLKGNAPDSADEKNQGEGEI